jgi:hypothetical protein
MFGLRSLRLRVNNLEKEVSELKEEMNNVLHFEKSKPIMSVNTTEKYNG